MDEHTERHVSQLQSIEMDALLQLGMSTSRLNRTDRLASRVRLSKGDERIAYWSVTQHRRHHHT